jgi:hypothetical protein
MAFAIVLAPAMVRAAPPDVSFDEFTDFGFGIKHLPPIDPAEDYESTTYADDYANVFPPIPGTPNGATFDRHIADKSIGGVANRLDGRWYHYAFLGTLARVDDATNEKATIVRRDVPEIDFLDLKAKTYVRLRGPEAMRLLEPRPAAFFAYIGTPKFREPEPEQGTFVMHVDVEDIRPEAAAVGLDELPTDPTASFGMRTLVFADSLTFTSAERTGACQSIDVVDRRLSYVAPGLDERVTVADEDWLDPATYLKPVAFFHRCTATGAFRGEIRPDERHFTLYRLDATKGTTSGLPRFPIDNWRFVRRTHVRHLSAADAPTFRIPADFTPEH